MANRDENDMALEILASGGAVIRSNGEDPGGIAAETVAAIKSFRPVWVRRQNDPEWATPRPHRARKVAGAVANGILQACWADGHIPEDLTGLMRFLCYEFKHSWPGGVRGDDSELFFDASLCDLGAFLWDRCNEHAGFKASEFNQEAAVHNALICLRNEERELQRFEERTKGTYGDAPQ